MRLTARSAVERYKTLKDVKRAEREAIQTEHPLFNVQYNDTAEARGVPPRLPGGNRAPGLVAACKGALRETTGTLSPAATAPMFQPDGSGLGLTGGPGSLGFPHEAGAGGRAADDLIRSALISLGEN